MSPLNTVLYVRHIIALVAHHAAHDLLCYFVFRPSQTPFSASTILFFWSTLIKTYVAYLARN